MTAIRPDAVAALCGERAPASPADSWHAIVDRTGAPGAARALTRLHRPVPTGDLKEALRAAISDAGREVADWLERPAAIVAFALATAQAVEQEFTTTEFWRDDLHGRAWRARWSRDRPEFRPESFRVVATTPRELLELRLIPTTRSLFQALRDPDDALECVHLVEQLATALALSPRELLPESLREAYRGLSERAAKSDHALRSLDALTGALRGDWLARFDSALAGARQALERPLPLGRPDRLPEIRAVLDLLGAAPRRSVFDVAIALAPIIEALRAEARRVVERDPDDGRQWYVGNNEHYLHNWD